MARSRVFSDGFIAAQREIFINASKDAGHDEGLLNPTKTDALLNYMRELVIDKEGNISGTREARQDYDGLIDLIAELRSNFIKTHGRFHSYVRALDQVKTNVIKSITASHPDFVKNNNEKVDENKNGITQLRLKRSLDLCGIVACSIWAVPQQSLTLFNLCRGTDHRGVPVCCVADTGTVTLCDAPTSIKTFYDKFNEKGREIENLQAGPERHYMK
jgi:hypothetical protein